MKKMKKILLLATVTLFSFNNVQAQMPNGSTGPDFTATDLNGNTINLYSDFLDEGIPVIMDISATWCPPCWGFHQTHAMKDIYMNYGDGGSGEIGVLYVEGDGSTGIAELQGSGNTQGDWVTGTPYPIIDNAGIANSYQIAYYPTMYGICPDRTVYEIGTGSAGALMQALISNCSSVTSFTGVVDNAAIDGGSAKICAGEDVDPATTVHNYGTNSISSFTAELFESGNPTAIDVNNWTGSLAAGGNVSFQFNPLISVANAADYEVVVSNPNGNIDNYPTLNQAEFNIDVASSTTENTATFKLVIDNYGSEITWNIKDGSGMTLASGGPYADGATGTEYTESIDLSSDGCYEVTINDTYGDGIISPGGYSLNSGGVFLMEEVGPAFGYLLVEPFSKSTVATSIKNQSYNNLNVYTNPAKDVLNIEGTYNSVDVFDMFGKLIISSEYTKSINVSSLANGIYMLNINTEEGIQTQRITITK